MKIEIYFNFIYIMHYNGLIFFWHCFNYPHGIWVEPLTFNMLKPSQERINMVNILTQNVLEKKMKKINWS
jgi:hypothetical protein